MRVLSPVGTFPLKLTGVRLRPGPLRLRQPWAPGTPK